MEAELGLPCLNGPLHCFVLLCRSEQPVLTCNPSPCLQYWTLQNLNTANLPVPTRKGLQQLPLADHWSLQM